MTTTPRVFSRWVFLLMLAVGCQFPDAQAAERKKSADRVQVVKKKPVRQVAARTKPQPKAVAKRAASSETLAKRSDSRKGSAIAASGSKRKLKAYAAPVSRPLWTVGRS